MPPPNTLSQPPDPGPPGREGPPGPAAGARPRVLGASEWPLHLAAAAGAAYAAVSLLANGGIAPVAALLLGSPVALLVLGLSASLEWWLHHPVASRRLAMVVALGAAALLLPVPAPWRAPGAGSLDGVCILVLAAALLLPRRWWSLTSALAVAVGCAGLVAVLGCLFVRAGHAEAAHYLNPNLGWALLLLAAGWLGDSAERRPVALLWESGSAGWLMRRLLPVLVIFPLLLAWILGAGGASSGTAPEHLWAGAITFVLISFLALLTLVWKAAGALDRLDVSRADLHAYAHEIGDLYHHAPCGYHSLDARGRFLNINDTELAWLGYRRDELMHHLGFADLLTPESRRLFERHFPALCASGVRQDLEIEMRRKDGSVLPAVVSTTVILDRTGRFLHTRSSVFDATQRKQAEAALRASEARNRAILDSAADAIITLTENGLIADVNPAAAQMFQLDPESARQRPVDELLDPDSPLHPLAQWAEEEAADEGRLPRRHECQARRADGSLFPAELALTRIGGQTPVVFTAFVRDLTERKRAEAELRASEEWLRSLLDSTGEGICTLDLEGRCTLVNPAALRLLGYDSAEELVGRELHPLIYHNRAGGPSCSPDQCRLFAAARRDAGAEFDDEVFWRRDGSSFPVEFRSYPIQCAGHPAGVIVSFIDITGRRTMENQIRQSQKMEAIGRLAAGIAHDFNNLLTIINGYAEMLLDESPTPSVTEKLRSVHQAGERAAVLTQQLLAFSRQQMLQPQVLDLNVKIADVEPLLRRTVSEDIDFQTSLADDLLPIKADPSQVDQVLMNLVLNARDAIPADRASGRIRIETANARFTSATVPPHSGLSPGEYVLLVVRDNGTGMRPETKLHIFEPFFTTKPQGQGTGLGLPTVFGIVRQSGGVVLVDSAWGRGTTMRIYLPAHRLEVVSRPVLVPPMRTSGKGECILVVEDEDGLRRMLLLLLRARGYVVLAASRPSEAIALGRDHSGDIDLLITDVIMPGMHGPALAEELTRMRPGLRVLFVSGYADHELPPGSFLKKPFAPDALAGKVREILDRGGTATPDRAHTMAGGR